MQCWAITQEHFKKWMSHLDLRLVHLAAGSPRLLSVCVHVATSFHMTWWQHDSENRFVSLECKYTWCRKLWCPGARLVWSQLQIFSKYNYSFFVGMLIEKHVFHFRKTVSILLVGHIRINVFSF